LQSLYQALSARKKGLDTILHYTLCDSVGGRSGTTLAGFAELDRALHFGAAHQILEMVFLDTLKRTIEEGNVS
jgi:hypothetical protein